MASISRHIHPAFSINVAPIEQVLPGFTAQDQAGETIPRAIILTDMQDGETHVYPLSDGMKDELVRQLTGGIVLPVNGAAPGAGWAG